MARKFKDVWAGPLLAIFMTACSPEQPSASAPSLETEAVPSNASSAVEPGTTDIQAQYQEWALAASAEVEAHFDVLNHVTTDVNGQLYFETGECSDQELSGDYANPSQKSSPDDRLADLAHRMVRYRISLTRGGYPTELWEEPVRRYEAAWLDEIERFPTGRPTDQPRTDAEQESLYHYRLAEELEADRVTLAPNLPPLRNGSECGGGEVLAIWQSAPPGGRVWVIRRMYWEHCRRRFGDGYDLNRCRGWWEAEPDQDHSVYGNYVSMAQWPNGDRGTSVHTLIYSAAAPYLRMIRVRPSIQRR